jgi:tripartite ATP-independent transporter DctM subunit
VGYALVIAIVVYRSMDWRSFKKCLLESALTSANTLFIIGSSTLFSYVLIREGISIQIAQFILGISSNPHVCLLVINVMLLILGMFMEPGAILTLMLPVLIPIAQGLSLDMVHFGLVIVLNLMIGQVTPPFGVCLFIVADVGKLELKKLYRSILPFLIPLIIVLFLITFVPGLVTWLPYSLITK